MKQNNSEIKIGFWGGPEISLIILNRLHDEGYTISFICTSPNRPKGRSLALTPPPTKVWSEKHGIPVFQPEKLKDQTFIQTLKNFDCDVFVVMAYGKIIPEEILNIPRAKSLNIHPSLLPKFRGPCPIESAILADEKNTGVTLMRMDKEMDHGPVVAQKKVAIEPWPPYAHELGKKLVEAGADLLVSTLPDWIGGKIREQEQDHERATYTKKIEKEDGLIDPSGDPYANYLKYKAYESWPSVYFFIEKTDAKRGQKIRIKISQASYIEGRFVIKKIIPEGRSEMNYADFLLC